MTPSVPLPGYHKEGDGYQCNVCSQDLRSRHALKQHHQSHKHRKWYTCDVCGTSVSSASILKDHMKRHYGQKEFQCEVCSKQFFSKLREMTKLCFCLLTCLVDIIVILHSLSAVKTVNL